MRKFLIPLVILVAATIYFSVFIVNLFIFSVLDDHANVQFFDDSLLTPVRPLGQGHFGLVELCCYERDPIRRKGHGELVAVKR